ncbi:ferritin-like domain-containing protein [Flavobacterium sp. 3HN19-14]|uniref:ferritin-like domain-containing protein n=1 Tax=Flavobacterium sp. 3HN19-14 TaxID=3448133 RepID=UPI003EE3FE78
MDTQKTIAALNELVEINNDRVEGYETASSETKAADLKGLFSGLQATSQKNLSALRAEVSKLGGTPEEGTRVSGKFFRAWMDVKAALSTDERQTVLNSCEFGEDKALEAYEHVLESHTDVLSTEQIAMIREQQSALRAITIG